ncbi:SsgA family sporulation/cell division regulator [Streptomyces sp. NPDC052114]|uniref:SsgA family sporulation/cell division regulator n=1 Tax=unclassified Streptomyces TaxID=2593676 RepID=UPI00342B887F
MVIILEKPARARLITPEACARALPVLLRYSAEDPLAIQIIFPPQASLDGAEVRWTFARQLLQQGMDTPAGIGDVRIWPCGRARTVLEFHSHQGLALLEFDRIVLRRFLVQSYAVVPAGGEIEGLDVDQGLARLLGGV